MYAIIEVGGKQFIVKNGDVIRVSHMNGNIEDVMTIPKVLLTHDGDKTTVGTPTVKGISVKAKIVSQTKGEKLHVRRYKSKVRYRKQIGFREQLTDLQIQTIGTA